MNEAEKMGFVIQAQSELQQRITQTKNICDQFKKSYSGFSSNIAQISLLAVLGIIFLMIIWAMFNIDLFLKIFSAQNYARDLLLAKIALTGMSLYIALHIYRKITLIYRIAKIDGHIYMVRNIEAYLQKKLDNIKSIAADVDKFIFSGANKILEPEYDADADIAKYSGLAKTYSNPDNSLLSAALTVMHWLSGSLFVSIFLLISTPFFADKINEWTKINEYGLTALVYTAFSLLLYIIIQELFGGTIRTNLHKNIKIIFGILFIAGICGVIFYYFFILKDSVLFSGFKDDTLLNNVFKMAVVYASLIIGAVISSIICFICKIKNRIINIFYLLCIYGITIIFVIRLKSFSINNYGSAAEAILALCIPITAAAFGASIISIIGAVKNKIFIFIAIGSGVVYAAAVLMICIGNNIAEYAIYNDFVGIFEEANDVIRFLLIIAGIIIVIYTVFSAGNGIFTAAIYAVICFVIIKYLSFLLTVLIVFALAAAVPLLPGLIPVLLASRINSRSPEKLRITLASILIAVCAAGFIIVKNNQGMPKPPASAQIETAKKVMVTSDALNLRAEPSGNAEILKILYKGDILTVTGNVNDGWTPVEHESVKGWVSSAFIE